MNVLHIILLIVISTLRDPFVNGAINGNADEVAITNTERMALKKLRFLIEKELPHDYMKRDLYLVHWLRASSLIANDAADKLRKMLQWRKENNIDHLEYEDFSWFVREFPFDMDSVDYIGRPVGSADIADWDARKVIVAGKRDEAIRFIFHMAEVAIKKIFEANDAGKNVSSGIILANLNGFNKVQHACAECMPIYRNLIVALDSYYPKMIHKVIGINTPMTFYPIFRTLSPLLGRNTRDIIKLFGTDSKQWKPYVLSLIPPEQLEPQFGGTKKSQHENDI